MYCLTVTLSQDRLTALSPPCQTMRKVLDNHGVVTGKTAESRINVTPHNRFFYRLCGFTLSPNNLITSLPRTSFLLSLPLLSRVRENHQHALFISRRNTEPFPKECLNTCTDTSKKNNDIKTHPATHSKMAE